MRVLFRSDAGPEIGTGHVMRCMALADAMASWGHEPVFAITAEALEVAPLLSSRPWKKILLENKAAEEVQIRPIASGMSGENFCAVVDHYGLGKPFEIALRTYADFIAVLEDRTDRTHHCDLLINSNAGVDPETYRALVPASCRLLLGPKHAPMRGEFADMRPDSLTRRSGDSPPKRILVSFGGSDPANGTGFALAALQPLSSRFRIDVAIGTAAPALGDLQKRYGEIAEFHAGTGRMAELMRDADLAIGAGGSTAWERAALGLPAILVTIADNQREIARALHEAGAALDLGPIHSLNPGKLTDAIEKMAADKTCIKKMSVAAGSLTDGRGALRIAIAMAGKEVLKDSSTVELRRAEPEDQDLVLGWQREPGARNFSRNPNPPSKEEHARWFPAAVNDPARMFAIVLCDGKECGFVRLDRKAMDRCEVSLLITQAGHGRGIGTAALRLVRKCAPKAALEAYILPENSASVAAFAKAGYTHAAEGLMRSVPREQNHHD